MAKAPPLCPSTHFPGASSPLPAPALSLLPAPSALSPPSSSQPLTPVGGGTFSWAALFQEVASLLLCSGDPLPPSEALLARSCWKSGAGAQECWVSWHVTLGPRCQIPEPWPGQTMPREGRSRTLMNSARGDQAPVPLPVSSSPPKALLLPSSILPLPAGEDTLLPRTSVLCPEPC